MSTRWQSLHVYYYDEDKTGLLLDAIRPLLEQISGQVTASYFVRHWRQGPHVRVPVLASEDVFDAVVRPAATDIVGGYLTSHPSITTIDEPALLAAHRELASLEDETGPLTPFIPDNTLLVAGHDRRLDVVGSDAAATLFEGFHAAATPLAFSMLAAMRSGRSRLAVGLEVLVGVVAAFCPPVTRGAVSLRSHADSFIAQSGDPNGLRTRFDDLYSAHRVALMAAVRDAVAALDTGADTAPFARECNALLVRVRDQAAALLESGLMSLDGPAGDARPATPWSGDWGDWVGDSPLHGAMTDDNGFAAALGGAAWFREYRLVLNLLYLHLYRVGVTGAERYLLCHLAANAIEDVYGVSALDEVRAFAKLTAVFEP